MFNLIFKEALRSLNASKFQTFIALLGIMVGVASVVGMFSIGESAKEKSLAGLKALGTDMVTGSMQQSDGSIMRRYLDKDILKASDVNLLFGDNHFILAISPRIMQFMPVHRSKASTHANVSGITESFDSFSKMRILYGRKLTPFDKDKNYCVLGYDLAGKFFGAPSEKIIGETIHLRKHRFFVVGVYEKAEFVSFADNVNESVFIPLRQAELLLETKKLTDFKAKIKEGFPADMAKVRIQDYFARRKHLSVQVETQEMLIKQAQEQATTSSNALIATAAISLLVGGIGIMNLMLISVKERKREIGIRRTCGAEQSQIAIQFLSEAVILSLIGGISGIMVGVVLSLAISFIAQWKPVIPLSSIVVSFAASLCIGVIFGYVPAKKASAMEIIDALKLD